MDRSIVSTWRGLDVRGVGGFGCVVAVALGLLIQAARAEELIQPPVCSFSPLKPIPPELKDYCKITTLPKADCHPILPGAQCHKIKVNLKAQTSEIEVGGYKVTTEHYNDSYLSPVIEALPGDTVAAHLENLLEPRATDGNQTMAHGAAGENPTNLHFFHGGIVTPNNAREDDIDAGKGNGDNIYVRLKNGMEATKPYSFDYSVPIPGEGMLDARVLEGDEDNEGEKSKTISHPDGLNWYHSHLHEISSDQVMGGLSGLLSVGEDNANVKAKCEKYPPDSKCNKETTELKKRTIVKYALLRDISLKNIRALPEDAKAKTAAEWAPEQRDFSGECAVWKKLDSPGAGDCNPKLRKGFCQRDQNSAWLFTLNGQRYPTITVEDGRNLLLRLGNLSANVAYWLELYSESTGKPLPLTVLSLDGVVPALPVPPDRAKIPVDARDFKDLLLMPASRAEIYVRNDNQDPPHPDTQVYILRTKRLDTGKDKWPEIQLARIVLEPSRAVSSIALALNAPIEKIPSECFVSQELQGPEPTPPKGCVRDLKPEKGEHRRVTFNQEDSKSGADWSITTEIVHPPAGPDQEENAFTPDKEATVSAPFNAYEQKDGSFDWKGDQHKHVCIHLDHKGSHKQLWVLTNFTGTLHNFHIHQIKFRLATLADLNRHHIKPPPASHTCDTSTKCELPDYKFYEDSPDPKTVWQWHDTIPVPPGQVFVIMSFDAAQQVGRFVFHCHILKHEDRGLMAPIEVWKRSAADLDR